ncbi:hypothetical protein [Bartonella tamiae]|uniref:Uncharacterized protein n=1 Tax=Bartonella tamiae Th239 TaxID=1094558 RepID=J0ZSB9_9HYPH|nr:hypothetical protein [Bartonella tamiae]EJF91658.1 hypothetical protein ME5_00037 [Bartonella tamiae Th239]EJF92667.1 hypothetical protein MEG_01837 [Bartonella tamiae Th307]
MIKKTLKEAQQLLLLPATVDEIAEQFSLLSGAMRLPKDMDSNSTAKAYMIALEGYSSFAVRKSVVDIIKGKAKGFNRTFMPSAPELSLYCESLEQSEHLKIKTVERIINAPEEEALIEIISDEKHQQLLKAFKSIGEAA